MKTSRSIQRLALLGVLLLGTAWSVTAQTQPREAAPPAASRKVVPVPRDNIQVEIWFDKQCGAPYRNGEKIIINFQTDSDGYLTVYDIDTRGQVSVLFPNRQYPDNFVQGGQTYSVPDRSYSYDLIIEGPEGIEYVDAVASTDPFYRWNYNEGEPYWVRDWGLKGRSAKQSLSDAYKESTEYQKRPEELSASGEESLARNDELSSQMREEIRSKITARPRSITESPRRSDFGTATCYFYVVGAADPVAAPQPSPDGYLQQQARDFARIPDFTIQPGQGRLLVTIPNAMLFDADSYALRYESRQQLDQVADILMRYPKTSVTVAGHVDSVGDASYNQRLTEYRAQTVMNYLISRGVAPYRMSSVGYGETVPLTSSSNESGRQRNRRIELDIRVNAQ